ncbi:hypothetical protein MKW94_015730 [Papaver nudicaule]|uniref:Major facilitator superfamily (MFS) profile domain-containing protein n=1 Tax=Papaver nudicaule TaxID=74823 RepID=A0AA41V3Q0_PAPNU|nr:hypothetical protein [Papaver nudicaule]
MASTTVNSATSSIFFNPHTKSQIHPKPISLISFSSSNFLQKRKNLNFQRVHLLPSRLELRKHSKVSAERESLSSDGGAGVVHQDEDFSKTSVILPFLFPALGALLFGYDIGATSGATIALQSPKLSGTTWFNLSSVQLGLVESSPFYGALIGSVLVYPIANFLGSKRELIIAAMLYTLGGLTTGFAPDHKVLVLGRLLYGLGIGLAMHGAPLYIAETCPSHIRGKLIFAKELMIVLGIWLGIAGNFVFDGVGGWRYMFGFSAPVAVLMGLGMWGLPESPCRLPLREVQGKASLQKYKEKAIAGLSRLSGRHAGDKASEKQGEETLVSLTEAYVDQESEGSFWEVFQGLSLKALTIGGGLILFLQITEHPSVLYYTGSVLQTAGFAVASVAARVAAVIGLLKMVLLFFLSAYYKILGGYPLVAVCALLVYVGCYQMSFVPVSLLMASEISPIRTRERGIISVLKNFGANALLFLAPSSFKEQMSTQLLSLFLFVGIALVSLLSVILIVPETKS